MSKGRAHNRVAPTLASAARFAAHARQRNDRRLSVTDLNRVVKRPSYGNEFITVEGKVKKVLVERVESLVHSSPPSVFVARPDPLPQVDAKIDNAVIGAIPRDHIDVVHVDIVAQ